MSELELKFKKAVWLVRNGPPKAGTSNETKLLYYSYFKQATEGDVQGAQPWKVNFEARAKWDAWAKVKGMPKEEAMQKYIDLIAKGARRAEPGRRAGEEGGGPPRHLGAAASTSSRGAGGVIGADLRTQNPSNLGEHRSSARGAPARGTRGARQRRDSLLAAIGPPTGASRPFPPCCADDPQWESDPALAKYEA